MHNVHFHVQVVDRLKNVFQMLAAPRFLHSHLIIGKEYTGNKLENCANPTFHHIQLTLTVTETNFFPPSFKLSFKVQIKFTFTYHDLGTEETTGSHESSEQYPEDCYARSLSS